MEYEEQNKKAETVTRPAPALTLKNSSMILGFENQSAKGFKSTRLKHSHRSNNLSPLDNSQRDSSDAAGSYQDTSVASDLNNGNRYRPVLESQEPPRIPRKVKNSDVP